MKSFLSFIALFVCLIPLSYSQSVNWTAVKPDFFPTNVSGQIHGISRISQMKFHPSNANKYYAISARGGLFMSSNAGTTWTVAPGTDFMPYARLASICIDHTNDQVLYLGTGDHNYYYSGNGVWKSTNGGTTFSQIGLGGLLVVDMIMDPLNNNTIVAVTNSGIYKTTNGGTTWTIKTAARPFDDLKQKTPTSRTLYACTTDSAFFRSTDFGDTWTQITNGIILPSGVTNGNGCRIALSAADTNLIYLGMVANAGMIYKSTDGGTTFTAVKTAVSPYLTYYANSSTSSGQGDYNFGIGADPVNANILYLVAHNVWKSTDGGLTWTQLTNWWQKVHTDMHQIVVNPYNNNQLWNLNDGGAWLSTDGGNNWSPKSDGINGYEIYHGNCSPTRKDMISIGTQDNGELYSTSAGWFCNRGGDWGAQCAFDYRANSSMVYYYGGNKRRLVTSGESTYGLSTTFTLDDIAFHRSNPNLAFAADSVIMRTTNLTATTPTWTQIASLGYIIKAIHVSVADANRLYIITNNGQIHVSTNAQAATPTFTTYTLPNTTGNKASITTVPNDPNVIYITANTKVYKSTNNGATWTQITYNLPSVNHIRILADEYSTNELVFVASNNTVYYKVGNATTWTIINTNLPSRTEAIDLSIFNDGTSNSSLRYASYGRSMWETPITNLKTLNAQFSASNTNPCLGSSVTFNDLSTGTITSRTWTFPGGSPSSSTATNPVVTYSAPGIYNVTLTISDGTNSSTLTIPNYISTNGAVLPLVEGFEGSVTPPDGWINMDNGTAGVAWAKTSLAGGYGVSSSSMMFDNYSWNNVGQKDELYVKKITLGGGFASAQLSFDVAYQVFSGYSDTLAVLISTDCGATFTTLYKKGGTVLSSAGSGGNNFVPTGAQWRTDNVDLTPYLGQGSVLLAFQNINGYGNKLYIDNINITSTCNAPSIPILNASNSTLCQGQNTTLSVTSGNLNSALNWIWYSGSCGGTQVGTGNSIVVSPSASTTYYVRGEGACVTPSTCASVSVTVNTLPSVTASASIATICNGSSTSLTGSGAATYTWMPGSLTGASVSVSPSASNTYTVTGADAFGCANTATVSVTVNALPSVSASASNATICNGSSTSLTGSGAATYTWMPGSLTGNSVSVSPSATTTYTVTGADAFGCANTATVLVTVNALPIVTASNVSGCNNIALAGTPAGGIFSVANPYSGPSTTYTYTYTDANSCTATSAPATITAGNSAVIALASAGNSSSILGTLCQSETLNNNTSVLFASSCTPIAMIQDQAAGSGQGSTQVCANVVAANIIANNGQVFAPRYYTVTPTSAEAATITFYLTQDDFGDYNANSGSMLQMPQSGSNTDPNIANIRVAQLATGSILSDAFTSHTPSSISWNSSDARWEVSVSVNASAASYYFYTLPSCNLSMTSVTVSGITASSAILNWAAVSGASEYNFRFRPVGTTTWNTTSPTTNTLTMNGLSASTTYEAQAKVRCNVNSSGLWGNLFTFTTTAPTSSSCPVPTGLVVSNVTASSAQFNWNAMGSPVSSYVLRYRIVGAPTWNNAGCPTNSKLITNLIQGNNYEVQISSYCTSLSQQTAFTPSATFSTPAQCQVPTGIAATNITSNSVTLVWNAMGAPTTSYVLRYRIQGSSTWNNAGCPTNNRYLNGLISGATYQVQVQTYCASIGTLSAYSSIYTFTTLGNACPVPTNVVASAITNTSALITWTDVAPQASGNRYILRYRTTGSTTWSNAGCAVNSRILNGLIPNTQYDVEVQSNCSATFNTSDFCATYHFQTTGSASKQEANSTSDISQLEKVNVYPNPTSNNIFVDIATLEESTWLLEIYDVSGRRLQSQSTLAKKGWQQINMNLNSLEESTYFLFIYKNGILTSTKKIIKQNN